MKMKKWRVALRKVYPRVSNSKALKVKTDQEPKVATREEAEALEVVTEVDTEAPEATAEAEAVEVATNQEKTSMMMDSK